MPIADNYLNGIMGFEGFTPRATWDYKQWTNGYGTRARFPGEVISQAEAKRRYQDEIEAANRHVKSLGVALDSGKEAALTSLTYNAGPKWMQSGLGQAVKSGDWNTAKNLFLQYNKAGGQTLPGLIKRRNAEASWLGGAVPDQTPAPTSSGPPSMTPNQTGVPIPASYSPEGLDMQRKLAMQLMQQGTDASPVQHWTQALARVLQGGVGAYQLNQANKQDGMMRSEGNQLLAQMLSPMTGTPGPAPQMATQAVSQPQAPMTPEQESVGRFASPGLVAALPQAQPAPQMPPAQVADASGQTIDPATLQKMLNNPYTKTYAEAYIKKQMTKGAEESPSNVREWEYFQKLPPDQQQKYIAMKRAEKYLDAGTQFVNPRTNEVIPKDLAGAERAKEVGTAQGKQAASAPGDISAAEQALGVLEQIKTDPYLDRGTGLSSVGNYIPGTGGYDFDALVEQAKSGAFLTAIQQLRGLGALSNAEGQTATAAVTRMKTGLSKEAFLKAVNDYEAVIKKGMAQAQARLGGGAQPQDTGDGWQDLGNGVRIREKR